MRQKIKNKTKNNSLLLFWAMAISVIFIILAFVIFALINKKQIQYNNHQYLINDTKHCANSLDQEILEGYQNIQVLSELMSSSLTSPTVDISNYQKLIHDSVFDFVEFADKEGKDHNITGSVSDASDRKYYFDAMQGNSGLELIYNSRATHETLLMFYAPVYYQKEIVGSLIGVYQATNRLTELLSQNYFGENAISYLCSSDGRIFASSESYNADLELYIDRVINADEKTISQIRNVLNTQESLEFSLENNKTGGYMMKLSQMDWYVVQIYPSIVNEQMILKSNVIGFSLVIVLIAVFIFLLIVVYHLHKLQQKEIQNVLIETQTLNEEKEQQLVILRSIADIYYSMHIIDLCKNRMVEFKSRNQVKEVVESIANPNANEIMHQVMLATMSEAYLEIGFEFSEVTTLSTRMKNKKFIYKDLLGRNVGWIRMMFIAIESDENGVPQKVICTTQIIDEQKKKEEKLLKESNTDELTGCYNRRAYEDDIVIYSDISTEDFVYIAMDINELKMVNDSLGHEAGDELILGAVMCMKQCLGNYGKIYRTGGDEFIAMIFADEATLNDIKIDFEAATDAWSGNLVDHVAVSCGYVTKRECPNMNVFEMARVADRRMYEEKALFYKRRGVDRRGQQAAHIALYKTYTKILKINLTEDSYQIINMDYDEQSLEKGFAKRLSDWLRGFGESGQVHADDLELYLQNTDLDFLRKKFATDKSGFIFMYRRNYDNVFKKVVMEMIPADDYTDDNQSLFLYVKSIDAE